MSDFDGKFEVYYKESMDNSEYCKLSQEEISYIQKLARPMLAE